MILQNFWRELQKPRVLKGQNTNVFRMNTTHPFGHLCFTDFCETWQEFMNPCAGELILNFFHEVVAFL